MERKECPICQRMFYCSDLYDKHVSVCEFFYQTRRVRLRESESWEALPSQAELFQLVKEMLYTQKQQAEKIARLEQQFRQVKKKALLTCTPIPSAPFAEWIHGFVVQHGHLHRVFNDDLFEGMKKCLEDRIDQEGLGAVPVRASADQPKVLYSYREGKWSVASRECIHELVEQLKAVFIDAYIQWEDEHQDTLNSTPENQELLVNYMMKITDNRLKERQYHELRTWLCKKVLYKLGGEGDR